MKEESLPDKEPVKDWDKIFTEYNESKEKFIVDGVEVEVYHPLEFKEYLKKYYPTPVKSIPAKESEQEKVKKLTEVEYNKQLIEKLKENHFLHLEKNKQIKELQAESVHLKSAYVIELKANETLRKQNQELQADIKVLKEKHNEIEKQCRELENYRVKKDLENKEGLKLGESIISKTIEILKSKP